MNDDLEKTKPIKVLKDIENIDNRNNRSEFHSEDEVLSRSEKYVEVLENDERRRELEEKIEEELAEKNISEAEKYLEEEKRNNENKVEPVLTSAMMSLEEKKKMNKKDKIKLFWKEATVKEKVMAIAIGVLALICIILLIVLIVKQFVKNDEKEKVTAPVDPPIVDTAPTLIADNYYYKDGVLYLLDNEDKEIGTYKCENADEKLCYVDINDYRDDFDVDLVLNENGTIKEQRVPIYNNEYVFIFDNKKQLDEKIKLYSISTQTVVGTYLEVKAFDDGYVIVEDENKKYGLLQLGSEVKEIIKPQYEYLGMIGGAENLVAKNKKGYVIINKKNKALSSAINSNLEIKNYSNSLFVVKSGNDYNVYDYESNLIASGYRFATVLDDYMAVVKSSKVYLRDKNNLKYHEEGIAIEGDDYIRKYIYNSEGKLNESKTEFVLGKNNNKVYIATYNDENEPEYKYFESLYPLANQKYKYLNYFDGSLYFYKDEAKEELIGSYKCNSLNNITDSSEEYTSCFPAKDTIYENNDLVTGAELNRKSIIPLINEKYVFIADGDSIYLYDLKGKKTMSTYATVNTYSANNDFVFGKYNGQVNVIALNKKGKYGMIKIDGESVSSVYSFEFNRLEKIGDFVLAQEPTNDWKLLFNGEAKTALMPEKIMGYIKSLEYLKTMSNGKYNVYSNSASKINNESYLYVELYNSFYAAVDSEKKLHLYDYSGVEITKSGYELVSNVYNNTDTPSFKVSLKNGIYTIAIYDGEKYVDNVYDPNKVEEPEEDENEPELPENNGSGNENENTGDEPNEEGGELPDASETPSVEAS